MNFDDWWPQDMGLTTLFGEALPTARHIAQAAWQASRENFVCPECEKNKAAYQSALAVTGNAVKVIQELESKLAIASEALEWYDECGTLDVIAKAALAKIKGEQP